MSESKHISPMFQTFYVENKFGVYITKIGLFFRTKSDKDGIRINIRDSFKSGQLSPNTLDIIPGTDVFKASSEITVSEDATAETIFEFEEPVYLFPDKYYAIAIITNDGVAYEIWAATVGDFNLGTTTSRVTQDPDTGVLFRASGGIARIPEGITDLKYKIYRAKFKSTGGTVVLKDANPSRQLLETNPFLTTNGSAVVRVYHPDHGFQINDKVHISGLTAGTSYNGITGAQMLGTRTVTQIDATGYKFTAAGTASSSGRVGGAEVKVTEQYVFDLLTPTIDHYLPRNVAKVTYSGQFCTSTSFAADSDDEQRYATTSNVTLIPSQTITFEQPHVILQDSNETVHFGGNESTRITATLTNLTTNDYISPYIDMQRASLVLMNNLIDRQDSAASVGFSTPINYVPETNPSGGTELAKHITKPVVLENPANGLKINFGAHTPIGAQIDTYYRITKVGEDSDIQLKNWIPITYDETPITDKDPNIFREYEANLGGEYYDQLPHFDQYQLKLVMRSQSSSRVPKIQDLRTIALAVDSA